MAKPKGLKLMAIIKGGLELNKNGLITRDLTTLFLLKYINAK